MTKALDAETEAKTEAVYLKTEADAHGSWPTVCGKKVSPKVVCYFLRNHFENFTQQ